MVPPFAADYPFLDVLWSTLIFMAFVLWIWLAVMCFGDIFRRKDASGIVKALWVVALIVLPYLGVLVYLIVNSGGIAERNEARVHEAQQAFDARVREASGSRRRRRGRRDRRGAAAARVRGDHRRRVRTAEGQGAR